MDKKKLRYLELGACGIEPADWASEYYPDDLPEDWKFAYYTNKFKQIFLTAEQWQRAELSEWFAEVGDEFRFYLELTGAQLSSADWESTVRLIQTANCAAVVRDAGVADELHGIVRRADLLIENKLLLQPLWQAEQENRQLALVHSVIALNPLQLRELFETFQQSVQCPELLVFLDTPYETAQKMRQMCELYGW
ncbi:MAG: hypothetical protein R3F02_20015 [Thiolinea sp.]